MKNYALEKIISTNEVIKTLTSFYLYLTSHVIQGKKYEIFYEMPIYLQQDGQLISGICDMVIEEENHLVLIDHKTHKGTKEELLKDAECYIKQMRIYKEVLEEAFQKKVKSSLFNYIAENILLTLD